MNPNLSSFLNLSRWLAAFLVVVHHARHLILADWRQVEEQTVYFQLVYFLTGLGHEAVIVFFVVSGFLVGGQTFERWRQDGPDFATYSCARFSRIYTVLIPALIVGAALDLIGLNYFNAGEFYRAAIARNAAGALDLPTMLGNLLMLQTILVDMLGSNTPLWSLANEWWYYSLFALVGAALTTSGNQRIGYALAAALLAFLLPAGLVLWGAIWCLGVFGYGWVASRKGLPLPVLGLGLLAIAIVLSRLRTNLHTVESPDPTIASFARDFMFASAYVIALASVSRLDGRFPLPRLNAWLAGFSYTTYCFHFPAMLLAVAVACQSFGLEIRAQPSGSSLLHVGATIGLVYLYCFACSRLTERHTAVIRRGLLLGCAGLKARFRAT